MLFTFFWQGLKSEDLAEIEVSENDLLKQTGKLLADVNFIKVIHYFQKISEILTYA